MMVRMLAFLALLSAGGAFFSACVSAPGEAVPLKPAAAEAPPAPAAPVEAKAQLAPPPPQVPEALLPAVKPVETPVKLLPFPAPGTVPPEPGLPASAAQRPSLLVAGLHTPVPPAPEAPKAPAPASLPAKEALPDKSGSADQKDVFKVEAEKPANPPQASKPKPPPAKVLTEPAKTLPAQAEAPQAATAPKIATPEPATSPVERGKEISVAGEVGKALKVALPGTGWIYLGDEENAGKIRYQGKDFAGGNTVFSFLAYSAGNYTLKFQQQDLAINSVRQNDVQVKVDPPKTPPATPLAGWNNSKRTGSVSGAKEPKAVPGETTRDPADGPETEEEKMEKLLKDGKTREALEEIERFIVDKGKTLANLDEWFIRLARLYETDRELKNMKKALWYYEKLRDSFPMSSYWDEADRRSRYIRRNFFDIR